MEIEDLVYNDYENYLVESEKDIKTINGYISDLVQFLEWLKLDCLENITNNSINLYKVHILDKLGYSPKTVNRKLVAVKHFIILNNLSVNIKQEKIHLQNFLDKTLTSEDIDRLIECAEAHGDIRARTIFLTLRMTGVRVHELIQFKVHDVEKDSITILGKGKKYRDVFISQRLRQGFQEYLPHRINKSDYLFTGREGGLKRTSIHNIIKQYAKLSGVDSDVAHAHSFRHYTGLALNERKLSIHEIAEVLGHSSLESTRVYLKQSKDKMLEIVDTL